MLTSAFVSFVCLDTCLDAAGVRPPLETDVNMSEGIPTGAAPDYTYKVIFEDRDHDVGRTVCMVVYCLGE
jgi:hypothetical protein